MKELTSSDSSQFYSAVCLEDFNLKVSSVSCCIINKKKKRREKETKPHLASVFKELVTFQKNLSVLFQNFLKDSVFVCFLKPEVPRMLRYRKCDIIVIP